MNMRNLLTDAYVAGLIDGEGCITIPGRGENGPLSVRIDVGMSDSAQPLLKSLACRYGGKVRFSRAPSRKWKGAHAWGVFGKSAAELLRRILPYMMLKRDQAQMAIRLQDIIDGLSRRPNGSAEWTTEARGRGKAIRRAIQQLNRKGPAPSMEDGWFARLVGDRWVTNQRDLFSDLGWVEWSETWPKAGIVSNGIACRRAPLMPRISEIGSSFLPTPTDASKGGGSSRSGNRINEIPALQGMSRKGMWPTPSARDWKSGKASEKTLSKNARPLNECVENTPSGGQLNPTWVEALMGFPCGWTDIAE